MTWDQNSKSCFFSEEHQGTVNSPKTFLPVKRNRSEQSWAEDTNVSGNVRRCFPTDFRCQPGSHHLSNKWMFKVKLWWRVQGSGNLDQTQPTSTEGSPMCWHSNGRQEVTFPLEGRTRFPPPVQVLDHTRGAGGASVETAPHTEEVQQVNLCTTGISRGFTDNSKEKQKVCEGLKVKKETIYK